VFQIVTEAVPIERADRAITIESCLPQIPASKQPGRLLRWFRR